MMQTLVVDKSVAPSRREAFAVFRSVTNRAPSTIRETEDSWRFRRFPPEKCKAKSYASKLLKKGVTAVFCERIVP